MDYWEKQLRKRAAAVARADQALDEDIAAARLGGHSFREIGAWADVNHERARSIAIRINGDSAALDAPYFTTKGSDYYHSTPTCSWWRRGRNAGDGTNPVEPLTASEARETGKPACQSPECQESAPAAPAEEEH